MKKLLLLLLISAAAVCRPCIADEASEALKIAELSDFSGKMLLFKAEQEAPLKIWESKVLAYPNTFIWYRWRDYDAAGVWQKPAIFEEIKKLTEE